MRILPAENEQVVCKLIYKGVSAPADTVHCSRCDVRIFIGFVPSYCPNCGAQFDIHLDESTHHEPRAKELRAESAESRLAIVEPLRELLEEAEERLTKYHKFDPQGAANGREMGCLTCCVIADLRSHKGELAALVPPVEKGEKG